MTSYTLYRYKKSKNRFGEEITITHPSLITNYEVSISDSNRLRDTKGNLTNSTTLIINVEAEDVKRFYKSVKEQLAYFPNISYHLENIEENDECNSNKLHQFENFVISSMLPYKSKNDRITVLLETVPYQIDLNKLKAAIPDGDDSESIRKVLYDCSFMRLNMALKMGTSDLIPNESREDIILGKVYVYYDDKGESVPVSKAFINTTLRPNYTRKVERVETVIINRLLKAHAEVKAFIDKTAIETDNFFEIITRDTEVVLPLAGDNLEIYSGYYDRLILPKVRTKDKKAYSELDKLFQKHFDFPKKDYKSKHNNLLPNSRVNVIIKGSCRDTKRNRYLKSQYNVTKIQIRQSELDKLKPLEDLLVDKIIQDAVDFGYIKYEDLPELEYKASTSYKPTDETSVSYYDERGVYQTTDPYSFFRNGNLIFYDVYTKETRQKDTFPLLLLYWDKNATSASSSFKYMRLSYTGLNRYQQYIKENSLELDFIEIGSVEYKEKLKDLDKIQYFGVKALAEIELRKIREKLQNSYDKLVSDKNILCFNSLLLTVLNNAVANFPLDLYLKTTLPFSNYLENSFSEQQIEILVEELEYYSKPDYKDIKTLLNTFTERAFKTINNSTVEFIFNKTV